jgi:hypothetical protein
MPEGTIAFRAAVSYTVLSTVYSALTAAYHFNSLLSIGVVLVRLHNIANVGASML